jgi:hypothetical protein
MHRNSHATAHSESRIICFDIVARDSSLESELDQLDL